MYTQYILNNQNIYATYKDKNRRSFVVMPIYIFTYKITAYSSISELTYLDIFLKNLLKSAGVEHCKLNKQRLTINNVQTCTSQKASQSTIKRFND